MKIVRNRSLVITDPCYIAKEGEWGKGEAFDWEDSTINSSIFTDYIWDDTVGGDGSWRVFEVDKILGEGGLMNFVDDYAIALDNVEDHPGNEYYQKTLDKLEAQQKEIGTFSADSGCTGVFYLDEVLKYNPDFQSGLSNKCYTIIEDFAGRVILYKTDEYFHILGIGNKTFYTIG
jgi:hypothetical protein